MKNNKIEESRQVYLNEINEYINVLRRLINAAMDHLEDASADAHHERCMEAFERSTIEAKYIIEINGVYGVADFKEEDEIVETYNECINIYKTNRLAVEEFIDKHMIGERTE